MKQHQHDTIKQLSISKILDAVDRIVGGLEKKIKLLRPRKRKQLRRSGACNAVGCQNMQAHSCNHCTVVKFTAWYLLEERQIVRPDQMLGRNVRYHKWKSRRIFNRISTGAL
jgi:cell division protease FtsH